MNSATGESRDPQAEFPRDSLLEFLRRSRAKFENAAQTSQMLDSIGLPADSAIFSDGDIDQRLSALADYLSDAAHLETAIKLLRRVANYGDGKLADAPPRESDGEGVALLKALEDLYLSRR